jgi:hypothetical protein
MQPSPLPLRLRGRRLVPLLLLAGVALAAVAAPAQANAQACVSHDSEWDPVPAVGSDDDGELAVWVPAGPDSSDGSEKVDTGCLNP